MPLASTDIPQANDPERVVRLAAHLLTGATDLPAEFAHPRDRLFYLGALRTLDALDPDQLRALAAGRSGFAAVFASSPVGSAWLAWAGAHDLTELDSASAADFLVACAPVSPSTAQRRASTLRRWLEWSVGPENAPPPPEVVPEEPPVPPPAPAPPLPRADANRLLAGLARSQARLQLDTVDLCFVAALYLRSDRDALASFEDETLVDVFEQVCDLVQPGAENPRKRATHAIQRLRDDRLLQRVDGSGLVRAGEYTLTGLAASVVDFFLRDETLTKESLVLLARMLLLNLADIRNKARQAQGDAWRIEVTGPLTVTIRDLVDGIRRRQRGLDADQEEVQEKIAGLLHERWFEAVSACEQLLDTTSVTLRELNEILLRDTHQFITALQEIQGLASSAGETSAEEAAQRVIEQVDVIASWGTARQRAWSEYYQYIHRFLQDVVRLDPDRALSQRLRALVGSFAERPFGLIVANAPSIRLMRPLEPRVERAVVAWAHERRERPLEEVPAEDRRAWIEERILEGMAAGADRLSQVTARVLEEVAPPAHSLAAGRVAEVVARIAYVTCERDNPWEAVSDGLEIGDWTLDGVREGQ